MYNRYQCNSGRVVQVRDSHEHNRPSAPAKAQNSPTPEPPRPVEAFKAAEKSPIHFPAFLSSGLEKLISDSIGELETEDIILLLILYLMYRESGDSELLIIMGAMFLL